jgi:hypothetical protein
MICGIKKIEDSKGPLLNVTDRVGELNITYDRKIYSREYVKIDKIEDILGTSVEYITPDDWDGKVYNSKKPTLILVYSNDRANLEFSKMSALIFLRLSEQYSYNLNFLACEFHDSLTSRNIDYYPAMAMYSRFDLVKGETPENNDGTMKRIDFLRGGPHAINVDNMFYNLSKNWIPTNILYTDGKYVWRMSKKKLGKWYKIMRE